MDGFDQYSRIQLNCPAQYQIQGASKAGRRTGFWVHGLRLILDAGLIIRKQPRAVLITHAHTDHSAMLPYIITCREPMTPILMPPSTYKPLQMLQNAIVALSDSQWTDFGEAVWTQQKCEVIQTQSGDIINHTKLKDLQIQVLKCYHRCESNAYGIQTRSQKLKFEYQHLSPIELKKLRLQGQELTQTQITPQFVFFGDTNIDALTQHTEWQQYPVVIIECTGYPTGEINYNDMCDQKYYNMGHIHLYDLIPVMKQHPDQQFILIHSSDMKNSHDLDVYEKDLQTHVNSNIIICKN